MEWVFSVFCFFFINRIYNESFELYNRDSTRSSVDEDKIPDFFYREAFIPDL